MDPSHMPQVLPHQSPVSRWRFCGTVVCYDDAALRQEHAGKGRCAAQEVPVVEVSVRAGRAIKSQPGKNDDSPELHDVINMVVDDPEEQSLSVRLVDEDGLVKKVRQSGTVCVHLLKGTCPALLEAKSTLLGSKLPPARAKCAHGLLLP